MLIPALFMRVKNLKTCICSSLKLYFGIFMYSLILVGNKIKSTVVRLTKIDEFQKHYDEFITYDSMNFKNRQK